MTNSEAGKLGYLKSKVKREEHYDLLRKEKLQGYVPVNCLHCGTPIPFEKRDCKFCNHSCAASHNNLGVQKNKGKTIPCNPEGNCLSCGVRVGVRRKYCTNQCQRDGENRVRLAIVAETGDLWQGWQTEGRIRFFLLKTRPTQCAICGITDWVGQPTPLVMDHIDGNSNNWLVDNVRLICPNCDAQTSTYKGRNRGNGRHNRRERYHAVKSY